MPINYFWSFIQSFSFTLLYKGTDRSIQSGLKEEKNLFAKHCQIISVQWQNDPRKKN